MLLQTHCQEDDEDVPFPGEEGVAEYDNFLQESAGGTLGPLASLVGGDLFIPKLEPILPRLFKKLVRKSHTSHFVCGRSILWLCMEHCNQIGCIENCTIFFCSKHHPHQLKGLLLLELWLR